MDGDMTTSSLSPSAFGPVKHEPAPLRNKIIKSLRHAIETGALRPGTRLVEKDLCQQLNVSRTSLREALRQLQAEGLLVDVNNRGLAVVEISRNDAENVYRIRGLIEGLVVEQFIDNASAEEKDALKADAGRLKAAYQSGRADEIVTIKREFYDRICTGADNQIGFDLLNKLTLLTSGLRRRSVERPARQKQSIKEVEALVAAILAGDKKAAHAAAETHVANAARSALDGT
ncbi:Transcriptional regulator, GntR family [Lutibaculum baratangense AMV1]|uniref:Transcriptional regulator, GntR family n=2 Tax=Lutibaculum TaxID=1358438 RepID=V4TJS0_9HYPH|nr:Transcriptional regulator, GntR family [Lutibaculum baratangense AMV1]